MFKQYLPLNQNKVNDDVMTRCLLLTCLNNTGADFTQIKLVVKS